MNNQDSDINNELYQATEKMLNFIRNNIKKNLDALGISDLTLAEINTLIAIGSGEAKSMKEIVIELDVANSTPTRTIDRLVRKRLVKRYNDEQDRRKVLVQLTRNGLSLIEQVHIKRDEQLHKAFSALTSDEKEAFASILYKVKDSLSLE